MTESIDAALSQIPGLKESMAGREQAPKPVDYFADPEEQGDDRDAPIAAAPLKVEDSDAVQAALSQIPGLRDRMGG